MHTFWPPKHLSFWPRVFERIEAAPGSTTFGGGGIDLWSNRHGECELFVHAPTPQHGVLAVLVGRWLAARMWLGCEIAMRSCYITTPWRWKICRCEPLTWAKWVPKPKNCQQAEWRQPEASDIEFCWRKHQQNWSIQVSGWWFQNASNHLNPFETQSNCLNCPSERILRIIERDSQQPLKKVFLFFAAEKDKFCPLSPFIPTTSWVPSRPCNTWSCQWFLDQKREHIPQKTSKNIKKHQRNMTKPIFGSRKGRFGVFVCPWLPFYVN